MTYSLDIEGNDQTDYVKSQSVTSKFNTLDLVLVDPAYPPLVGDYVTQSDPDWHGNIVRVEITDVVEKGAHVLHSVSAVNSDVAATATAPYNLSDSPNLSTTFGYRQLSTQTILNADGSQETTGRCTVFRSGLRAGQTITVTSVNHGMSAKSFTITQVTVRWPTKEANPTWDLEFGDSTKTFNEFLPNPAPTCDPDQVLNPTVVYSWTFTSHEDDDATNTYNSGLRRGGPALGNIDIFDGYYGRNGAGHFTSEKLPMSANTQYNFRLDGYWYWNPVYRNTDVIWYDTGGGVLRTDRWITGSGQPYRTRVDNLNVLLTSPVGTTDCRMRFSNFFGFFADNIFIERPGSATASDNDPYCLVAGPGDSPYYAKSDDPRFSSLENEISDVAALVDATNINIAQILSAHRFPISAHRGDIGSADSYPEDSMEAVRQAAFKGAAIIGWDACQSSDGTWWGSHDTTVDRTTDGTGTISALTDAYLEARVYDAGYGYDAIRHTSIGMATLDDVLTALEQYGVILTVELKSGNAADLAEAIVDAGWGSRTIIEVSSLDDAAAVKEVDQSLTTLVNQSVSGSETSDDVDWLSWDCSTMTSLSASQAKAPKPIKAYTSIDVYGTDESLAFENTWAWGARSFQTNNLDAALIYLRSDLTFPGNGHWEPVTNDTPSSPDTVYEDTGGDIVMTWVAD